MWPVALLYLAIAAGTTWPLSAQLGAHLPAGTDTLSHYWNGWWVREALSRGQSPYFVNVLFYPTGISAVYKNFAWLYIASWIALQTLFGGIAAYNLVFILGLALCGAAAFLLVHDLTGSWGAAFVSGLIYQCWPYRMTQPSHPNMMSTAAIPLAMLFLRRAARRGRWQDGALAGVALALTGYTRWQLLIPAAIAGTVILLFDLPGRARRRQIGALALGALVTSLALAPPALLLIDELRARPAALVIEDDEALMQTDLLAYLTPPSRHTLLGAWTDPTYRRYYAGRGSRFEFSPYIGLIPALLALFGIAKTRLSRSAPWIILALLFVLLALGPELRVNGIPLPGVPMPYNLAARTFVIRLMRTPERYNMPLALPIAALAGMGLERGLAGADRRRKRTLYTALVALGVSLEYLVLPLPLQSATLSPFYAQIAQDPSPGAVLNVPVDPYDSKEYMYAQTTHGRPILQGRVSRYPSGAFDYLDGQPWLRAMRQAKSIPPPHTDLSRQWDALAEDGVRYLIAHKNKLGDRWPTWARYLAIEPVYEDASILAYRIDPAGRSDLDLEVEVAPGLGIIRAETSGDCLAPGAELDVDAAWGATAPPGANLDVELALVSPSGKLAQSRTMALSPDWPTGEWPGHTVAWGRYALTLPITCPTGSALLTLAVHSSETGVPLGPPAEIGRLEVRDAPCAFDPPPGAVRTDALFGGQMRLLGYKLSQGESQIDLTLFWRSERRMATRYKVFVHIYDPATGIPIAQDDAEPLRWTYPTTRWYPGEEVTDPIPIPTGEIPPGSYAVAVGVYNPAAGRLEVLDAQGRPRPDGRLVLPGERVQIDAP